jgi:hypothetical protein
MRGVLHNCCPFRFAVHKIPPLQYNFPQPIGKYNVKLVRLDLTLMVEALFALRVALSLS